MEMKGEMEMLKNMTRMSLDEQNKAINEQKKDIDHLRTMVTNETKMNDYYRSDLDTLKKTVPEILKMVNSQKGETSGLSVGSYSDRTEDRIERLEQTINGQKKEMDQIRSAQPRPNKVTALVSDVNKLSNDLNQMRILMARQQTLLDQQAAEVKRMKDNVVPIGFVYVQLFGQPDPVKIWPNMEWHNISGEYAGLFFRAEGGQARGFGQVQEQQSPALEFYTGYCYESSAYNMWHRLGDGDRDRFLYTGGGDGNNWGIKMRPSPDELRPRNSTMRIWKRVR